MRRIVVGFAVVFVLLPGEAESVKRLEDIDRRMVTEFSVVSNGVKWIDGLALPLEGKSSADVSRYYDRFTDSVTTNVNQGVHWLKRFTAGMQFRFSTDSSKLRFRWHPICHLLESDNLSRHGQSGIDVYRFDEKTRRWRYVATGSPKSQQEGGAFGVDWTPGEACIVNLPNYNGLKDFALGIDEGAEVKPLPPRASGVVKPVVFYGTSITQGGCASRPGMGFVNIVGRDLDVPVINLGFSGSGRMELEMAGHLADIDASCYVIDTLWNAGGERHEEFVRILRAKRPRVPIVITDKYDARGCAPKGRTCLAHTAYEKLVAEGFDRLYWLDWDKVYDPDGEDTVDGVHASDKGMMNIACALEPLIIKALALNERQVIASQGAWESRSDSGSGARGLPPVVMMRFSSAQTRSSDEWKETAKALAENPGCCDEVWFSTGESFPSLDWHREHVRCVRGAAEDVRKLGLGVSLQFEATIGHGDGFPTAEEKRIFDKAWTGWTGCDGTECAYCNCPRQSDFLNRLADISEIYAAIRPDVVWIDDDLRMTNHDPVDGKDAPGCWCAKCVADFAAEERFPWTRETLAAAHLKDADLRLRWHDFSARSMAEVACTIARAFRRVSPKTKMGLQTGADRARMNEVVVRALAKETGEKVGFRMGGGGYWDLSPYVAIAKATQLVAKRPEMNVEDVVDNWCIEVESYPRAYGSRSVRSMALESFVSMAWGFDATSLFVMDRRSESDELYSDYLLGPLVAVTGFLNRYRAANVNTAPAGFTCPGLGFDDTRKLMGIPVLPGIGRSWGEIDSGCEKFPGLGAVWGDFRADLMPNFEVTPSAKLQAVRGRLCATAPLELLSPFIGLVLPRVALDGSIQTVGLVGTRLDPQQNVVLRIETASESVIWHELGTAPKALSVKTVGGCRQVTVPSIGAWSMGYLDLACGVK